MIIERRNGGATSSSRVSSFSVRRSSARLAAPRRLDDEAVRLAVISGLAWIRRQQARFEQQVRQSEREMVTGESQYFQGRYSGGGAENTSQSVVSRAIT
jgi:predicted metal-dependent hydrolase